MFVRGLDEVCRRLCVSGKCGFMFLMLASAGCGDGSESNPITAPLPNRT